MTVDRCFKASPYEEKIYIRDVYRFFWEKVKLYLSTNNPSDHCAMTITGTPGTGKTQFLYYMLCKIRNEGKWKVILTLGKRHFVLDDHPSEVKQVSSFEGFVYIFDPDNMSDTEPLPGFVNCWIIFIASPDPRHFYNIKKLPKIDYHMPLWTWKEIEDCRKNVFPHCSETEVKNCFFKWGGIPASCFRDLRLEKKFEIKLHNVKFLQSLVQRMLETDDFIDHRAFEEMQWITHLEPTNDYKNAKFVWASNYVREKVFAKVPKLYRSYAYRNKLLKASDEIGVGHVYETYVTAIFCHKFEECDIPSTYKQGNELTAKLFENPTSQELKIPYPTEWECISEDSTIQVVKENRLYRPLSANFPTVDLVLPPNLIQITSAKSHSVNMKGVMAVKKIFPGVAKWNLIFVTRSPDNFNYIGKMQCIENEIDVYRMIIGFEEEEGDPN